MVEKVNDINKSTLIFQSDHTQVERYSSTPAQTTPIVGTAEEYVSCWIHAQSYVNPRQNESMA